MPMASRMLFCASTRNSWGRTWSTSRSSGREILRAASTARRTSSRSMSRGRLPSVMPPRLLAPRTWLPATPMSASSTGTFATPSASSTARRIELTVASRFTIKPLRKPLDSAAPSARNFTRSPSISAIRTDVLVLPMSSPTRYLSFFTEPPLPSNSVFFLAPLPIVIQFCRYCRAHIFSSTSCRSLSSFFFLAIPAPMLSSGPAAPVMNLFSRGGRARAHVGIHDHLPRVLQIDGLHPPRVRLPLREVVDEHFELAGKIAGAEMDGDRLRIGHTREAGHDHAQVRRIRKIRFADVLGRAAAHEINLLEELLIKLHAFFALITGHIFGHTA